MVPFGLLKNIKTTENKSAFLLFHQGRHHASFVRSRRTCFSLLDHVVHLSGAKKTGAKSGASQPTSWNSIAGKSSGTNGFPTANVSGCETKSQELRLSQIWNSEKQLPPNARTIQKRRWPNKRD
jgi:hypothetical protein